MSQGNRGGRLSLVVRGLGLVASLTLVARLIDLPTAARAVLTVPLVITAAALVLCALRIALLTVRWHVLVPASSDLSRGRLFRLIMAGGAMGLFLPGMIAGDVVRGVGAVRGASSERIGAALSVVMDRSVGLASILLLGLVFALGADGLEARWRYVAFIVGVACVFVGILAIGTTPGLAGRLIEASKTWGGLGEQLAVRLERLPGVVGQIREHPERLFLALLISLPIHVAWFVIVWLVAGSLGIEVGFLALAAVTTLVWIMTMLPVSVAGIGIRELGYVLLLAGEGESEVAVGALALYQSALMVFLNITGLPFLLGDLEGREGIQRSSAR